MTPSGWEPVVEERDDTVSVTAAAALHGLLDSPGEPPGPGNPLPPLWHWLAFLPDAPQRDLGLDGHPKPGSFMPPTGLAGRMFAGGQLELRSTVAVGAPLHRSSIVTRVEEKTGRSGRLVFVEVTNEVSVAGVPAIVETQTIVYRERVATVREPHLTGAGLAPIDEDGWDWRIDLGTEPTLLFRFSALTYNAHRIHYDRDYATGVEGYPGLVVHGPLQAVGLAELCRRNAGGRPVSRFSFRAVGPVFDGAPMRLRGRPIGDDRGELRALDGHGQCTMTAEATFGPFVSVLEPRVGP